MKLAGEPTVGATSSPQNYQFDFDLGPGFSKAQPTASLKEQKQKASTAAAGGGSEPTQGRNPHYMTDLLLLSQRVKFSCGHHRFKYERNWLIC